MLSEVNHSALLGPMARELIHAVIVPAGVATVYWVVEPAVVMRPISTPRANHSAPSDPATITPGPLRPGGRGNSAIAPAVVIRPIRLPFHSVNQSAPSRPAVIPLGWLLGVGMGNSVIAPAVVIRPIWLPACSVNHSAPSGPAVIDWGWLLAVGT